MLAGEEVALALTYLLAGGVPWKLRERCRGSYLMLVASAGSVFTKSVSSRSWISRATGALVEACRRHRRVEVCERAVLCLRSRLKNEAVTSCKAMFVLVEGCVDGLAVAAFDSKRFTSVVHSAGLVCDLDFRGAGVPQPDWATSSYSAGQSDRGRQETLGERLSECIINCQSASKC